MNLIACVNNNWCIGKDGKLLYHIPEDLKQFKEFTLNSVVVMGYNTYLSIPGHHLFNRLNIVLTHKNLDDKAVLVVHSIEELFKQLYENYGTKNVWIIGGAKIYRQLLKYCEEACITKVNDNLVGDCFIENLDVNSSWELIDTRPLVENVTLNLYQNKKVKRYIPKDYVYKVKTITTLYLDNDENNWEDEIPEQYFDVIKKGSVLYIYKVIEDGESHYEAWNSNYEPKIIWQAGDEFILENNKDWLKEVK